MFSSIVTYYFLFFSLVVLAAASRRVLRLPLATRLRDSVDVDPGSSAESATGAPTSLRNSPQQAAAR